MSGNANWKIIGANSGNMSRHRNVKASKLNYEDGKWKSVYDASGNKKIVHDFSDNLTNQNAVVGIGTSSPFSRLSLGSNLGDGTIGNEETIGQIAAFALHEESNGTKFHGLSYISDVSSNQNPDISVNALALYSNTSTENMSLSTAKTYITDDGVVRIGGMPRTGPAVDNAADFAAYPKIALDISGSMQIDGFISFCDLKSATNTDNVANNSGDGGLDGTRKIPYGAIWVGKRSASTGEPALYMQGTDKNRIELASTSQVTAASTTAWDFSDNVIAGKYIYNAIPSDTDGAVNVTITGAQHNTFTPAEALGNADFSRNFINALSIRGGNMSISSVNTFTIMAGSEEITGLGENTKPIQAGYTPQQLGLSGEITDASRSGVLFIEKQLLIGMGSDWLDDGLVDDLTGFTAKALIDISGGTPYPIPAIMIGHGLSQLPDTGQKIPRATNSIIVGDLNSAVIGKEDISGNVKNSFIAGESNTIDTAKTCVVIGNTNKIADSSGSLLVLGQENGSTAILGIKATNSIIVGYKNNVSSSFDQYKDTTKAGNIIFGEENVYTSEDPLVTGNNNVIFGSDNNINATEDSFIQGKTNRTYGKELTVIGKSNKVGIDRVASASASLSSYKVESSFIHGFQNQVLGPSANNLLSNVYAMGYENMIDMSNNATLDTKDTFILLGSHADISGDNVDTSNVKFAFGSHNMWTARGAGDTVNGNIFTIDHSGNTHIYGDLIVDGSSVMLRTNFFDVSDNNITLNSAENDPSGGGFTILDSGDPHVFKWVGSPGTDGSFNTGTADLSTNNMFVGGKLTVTGLIDPTGLVLDTQVSTPAQIASKATLWFDGSDLYFNIGTGGNQKIGTTGGGAGSGMTEWIAAATNGTNQTIDAANTTLTFESSDTAFLTVTTAASRKIQYGVKEGGASTVLTTDSGNALSWSTVTNDMLAGSIANDKLSNSKVTIGTTDVDLGATVTTFAGLTSVTSTDFSGALTGNADTATALETARNIGGVSFNGTTSIVPNTIAVNDTANSGCFVALFEGATGNKNPKTDALLTYDAPTGILSATGFSGALTGNADTATALEGSSHTQNTVYAAPDGSAGAASFRALVSGDIPDEAVTYAKMQHAAANTILVRDANSIGDISAKAVADTQILIGDGDGFTAAALSNDVTMTNAGAVTIANGAVTYAKMQDTTTNDRVLGAATAGTIGEVQVSNNMLVNKKVTIGSTDVDLGATVTSFAGLTSVTSTDFSGALTGNADTATTSTNITGGLVNQIPFQSATDATTFDADLTYTAATDTLSATNFSGGGVTLDPNAAAGGALTISNTTTQTSAELVKITGTAGQDALKVIDGSANFTGDVIMGGLTHFQSWIEHTAVGGGGQTPIPYAKTTYLLNTLTGGVNSFSLSNGNAGTPPPMNGQMIICIFHTDGAAPASSAVCYIQLYDSLNANGSYGTWTLNVVGDSVTLIYISPRWRVIGNFGATFGP